MLGIFTNSADGLDEAEGLWHENPPIGRGKHSVRLYADRIKSGALPHTP